MRHLFLSLALTLFIGVAYSQSNVAYIYSSEVFNQLEQYKEAKQSIDAFAKRSQESIDNNLKQAKSLFEIYNNAISTTSSSEMASLKKTIISIEDEANKLQERVFGKEGELQKLQKQLMEPIETKVVSAVNIIAQQKKYDMVFDLSIVKNTIFQSPKVNITNDVIAYLKKVGSTTTK